MYIKSDFLTVPVSKFKLNSKAKHTILTHFPKKYITDDTGATVQVFDTMYIASGQSPINMTPSTDKVLKVFGTSVEAMQAQDWHGVEAAWFNFKYVLPESTAISKLAIYAEIFRHNKVGVKCSAQFNLISYDVLTPASGIIADFTAGTGLSKYGHLVTQVNSIPLLPDGSRDPSFITQDDQNWYIAYADIAQQAFERKFSVKAATSTKELIGYNKTTSFDGTVTQVPKYKVTYTTTIVMDYTRKADIPIAIDLDPLLSRVIANNVYDSRFLDNYFVDAPTSIYANVSTYETVESIDQDGNVKDTVVASSTAKYLRVDAVAAMKLKTFVALIRAAFSFGYALKEVEWWMKVVAAVIVIIIIIIAVVITYFTAGIGAMAWPQAIAAIASVVAITATVIAVALTLYLEELAKQGFVGGGGVIRNTILLAQDIAKYAGYVAMLTGIYGIVQSGFTTAGTAASSSAVPSGATTTGTTATGAITYTLPMSSSAIFAQVSSWVSSAGNVALEYMNDKVGDDLAARQGEVDAQVALMEDYSSPKAIVTLQQDFNTYSFMDINAKMDSMAYKLTQGLITESTLKYYD